MVELVLVRHGETEWNTEKVFRGRADIPLNKTGLVQAGRLAAYLGNEDIDAIYTSPLTRAVQTAAPLAKRCGLQPVPIQDLTDMDFGKWQGLTVGQVEEQFPELYRDWNDMPEQVAVPGGESVTDVLDRAYPFIRDAIVRCGEGRIVIVTHRVVLKMLTGRLLGLPASSFWIFRIDPGGITRFQVEEGRTILAAHNDVAYQAGTAGKTADF